MELVVENSAFNFNWTAYDQNASLFVAFDIYDVSTGSPVFVSTVAGTYANHGMYTGTYTGVTSGKTYLVIGAAYTDGTFTTLNSLYGPDANTFQMITPDVTFLGFNYGTYDANDGLFVRATIYDVTTGSPVFVQNSIMALVAHGVYFGSFTGTVHHTYAIVTVVYTDNTYTVVDTNRAPGSESFDCITLTVIKNSFSSGILIGQSTEAILVEGIC